jgi:kynureninase
LQLTEHLLDAASAAGFETRTPRERAVRGGTVTIWHPEAERLTRGLLEREIICDFRPGAGLRLSPHFYNTEEECDLAIATLSELAGGR